MNLEVVLTENFKNSVAVLATCIVSTVVKDPTLASDTLTYHNIGSYITTPESLKRP